MHSTTVPSEAIMPTSSVIFVFICSARELNSIHTLEGQDSCPLFVEYIVEHAPAIIIYTTAVNHMDGRVSLYTNH